MISRWIEQRRRVGERIKGLVAAGKPIEEVAAETGVSESTVYRIIKVPGEKTCLVNTSEKHAETIRAMTAAGKTGVEIARVTGLSKSTIYNFWDRNGIRPEDASFRKHEEEDLPWFPGPDAPIYNDGFMLKPEHRARLEEVRFLRRIGTPIAQKHAKKKEPKL